MQFIDALRAYAILMMLQGHFVHIMLDPDFCDLAHPIYAAWTFMRGMTAPIFFTITGLVFTYLLLRQGLPLGDNPRVKKGLRRGLQLIGIGYLLQLNWLNLVSLSPRAHWWEVDVLHCIGLGLITLIGLYALHQKTGLSLPGLMLTVGLVLFVAEPLAKGTDWTWLPRALEHYFTKAHGSTFTPIPWVGYTLIGGVIGWHISRDTALYRTGWWPVFFLLTGWLLDSYSADGLLYLHEWSGLLVFKQMAYNNYLLIRLGHVCWVIAAFIWLEVLFRRFPPLLLKVGSETLFIYGAHYVLLYGSWLGVGITSLGKYSLSPWACVAGAAGFVLLFLLLVHRLDALRGGWRRARRLGRVWLLRSGPTWLCQACGQLLIWRQLLLRRLPVGRTR